MSPEDGWRGREEIWELRMDVVIKRAYDYALAFQSCGAVLFGETEKERERERNVV